MHGWDASNLSSKRTARFILPTLSQRNSMSEVRFLASGERHGYCCIRFNPQSNLGDMQRPACSDLDVLFNSCSSHAAQYGIPLQIRDSSAWAAAKYLQGTVDLSVTTSTWVWKKATNAWLFLRHRVRNPRRHESSTLELLGALDV